MKFALETCYPRNRLMYNMEVMKIYFSAAISCKDKFEKYYKRIVSCLEKNGHEVQSDHIFEVNSQDLFDQDDNERENYYQKFLRWIKNADLVVFEASSPSISLEHETSVTLSKGKPTIVMFKDSGKLSLLRGVKSDKFSMVEYNDENLEEELEFYVGKAKEQLETRFTMILPNEMVSFLDEMAESGVNRSEFIRRLIKGEMERVEK